MQAALTELLVEHIEVVAGQSLGVLEGTHSTYMYVCNAETLSTLFSNPYGITGLHLQGTLGDQCWDVYPYRFADGLPVHTLLTLSGLDMVFHLQREFKIDGDIGSPC